MVRADTDSERVVLQFFETLSTGDLEKLRPLLHEEATWAPQVQGVPGEGVHRGKKGIIDEFLAPVRGLFVPGDPKVYPTSIASKGPLVMIETQGKGMLSDGRQYNNLYCWAVEVRDAKIFAIREYMDSLYISKLFPAG